MQPEIREVWSTSAPSVTARRASHEVFIAFRDVRGSRKGAGGAASVGLEGCPNPSTAPNIFSSRTPTVRGLSPKVGSSAVGSLRDGVRTATEELILLLGSGSALMARQWKRTRSCSTLACPTFGRQSQVYQALAQTALQRHVRGLLRSRRIGGFVLSIDGQTKKMQARLAAFARSLLAAAPAQRPRDHRAHGFLRDLREHPCGCWLHGQEAQLTTCALCAYGGPRPVPVVLLGLDVSGNLPNKVCDDRHIPRLSLTDKRPWSITSDCRPRERGTGHRVA